MLGNKITDNSIYGKDKYNNNYCSDGYYQSMGMTELNDLIHDELDTLIDNMLTGGESWNMQQSDINESFVRIPT